MAHLLAFQANEDRERDNLEQPRYGDDERRGHLNEVALDEVADRHHGDGKQCKADYEREHHTAVLVVGLYPTPRQQPAHDSVGHAQRAAQVDENEEADEQHGHAAPLRIAVAVALQRSIFSGCRTLGLVDVLRQMSDDREIVGTAVDVDIVLQHLIARLRKSKQLAHLLLDALVVAALGLEALEELLHIVAQHGGEAYALETVLQLLPRQVEGLVGAVVGHLVGERAGLSVRAMS